MADIKFRDTAHHDFFLENMMKCRVEMCIPVCFDGESLRQAKAKENLKLYKQLTGK